MNIEQIRIDLLSYYDQLEEPKMNRTAWFYRDGGVKDTIEKAHPNYFYSTEPKTGKIKSIIRTYLGSFSDDCTKDELTTIEKWLNT